jgi:putative membrane protein
MEGNRKRNLSIKKELNEMMTGFGYGCFGNWGSYGWIGMILNLAILLVAIGGVIWLVTWVVRRNDRRGETPSAFTGMLSPREIIQARYARGEITREQYLEMLGDLN